MRTLTLPALIALVLTLGACAAPLSVQMDDLKKSAACCQDVAQIKPSASVEAGIASALTPNSPLIIVDGQRTPAMVFSVTEGLAGKVLKVRAAPSEPGFGNRATLRFAAIAVMFLNANGQVVASPSDSGPKGGPSGSVYYSYAMWRQVTIPSTAVSAVFYADPKLYGTKQSLNYQFGGLVPVAGILIPMSANANAEYAVYGEFSAQIINVK